MLRYDPCWVPSLSQLLISVVFIRRAVSGVSRIALDVFYDIMQVIEGRCHSPSSASELSPGPYWCVHIVSLARFICPAFSFMTQVSNTPLRFLPALVPAEVSACQPQEEQSFVQEELLMVVLTWQRGPHPSVKIRSHVRLNPRLHGTAPF